MTEEIFFAQNVKCDGCATRIREGLLAISEIESVLVDIPTGQVTVRGSSILRPTIRAKLAELGYPDKSNEVYG